jgi:TetR/AcrR family transcriptional regulator, repressor for neighboring sulfatase
MSQNSKKNLSENNGNSDSPHGRKAIKEAVLNATEKLLSEYSPNEITVRQIAKEAGVNHSLIHRHFGTKEKVIIAVHEQMIGKMSSATADIENIVGNVKLFFKASEQNSSRRILLTKAMLDGVSPHLIQNHFPVMHQLLNLAKKRSAEKETPSKYDDEVLVAFLTASVMGWFLYQPFLIASLGLENKNKDDIHNQLIEMLEEIIEKID